MLPLFLLLLAAVLNAQDFSEYKVEKLAGGYTFTEGPAWSRDGFLIWSDVPNNKIWKWAPGEKPVEFRTESNGANGNTFDSRGNLYTCESRTRRVTRTDKKGNIAVVAEQWEGKRLNAPNDIVVRRDGHIFFTDPAFGNQADGRELDFYGVYRVSPKGEMSLIAKPKGRPNGIALSPNGRILYVANSDERCIYAYDLNRDGAASNERVLIARRMAYASTKRETSTSPRRTSPSIPPRGSCCTRLSSRRPPATAPSATPTWPRCTSPLTRPSIAFALA